VLYIVCKRENNICTQITSKAITYLSFWEGIDLYRMTGDISRPYRWSISESCVKEIPRDIAEV
jgi:hypothetical protein